MQAKNNAPDSYCIIEECIRAYSQYKGRQHILNRSEYFKAALWDIKNKKYLKYILDRMDAEAPRSGHNYIVNKPDETAQSFLIKARREDIQTRWNFRNEKRASRKRFERHNRLAEKTLQKAKQDIKKREQRIRNQKTKFNNAKCQHKLETQKQLNKAKQMNSAMADKSQQAARIARKSAAKDHLASNKKVTGVSNKSKSLILGKSAAHKLRKLASNRFLRRTAIGLGLTYALHKVSSIIHNTSDRRAIPEHYDRTYDMIKENMTDFGSPVKLYKTASKTITPYKSSLRKGLRISTRQVRNNNLALSLSDKAIRHQEY